MSPRVCPASSLTASRPPVSRIPSRPLFPLSGSRAHPINCHPDTSRRFDYKTTPPTRPRAQNARARSSAMTGSPSSAPADDPRAARTRKRKQNPAPRPPSHPLQAARQIREEGRTSGRTPRPLLRPRLARRDGARVRARGVWRLRRVDWLSVGVLCVVCMFRRSCVVHLLVVSRRTVPAVPCTLRVLRYSTVLLAFRSLIILVRVWGRDPPGWRSSRVAAERVPAPPVRRTPLGSSHWRRRDRRRAKLHEPSAITGIKVTLIDWLICRAPARVRVRARAYIDARS